MFKSARIKLTAWYLLIIMTISLSFSGVIYYGTSREMERSFRRIDLRHRAEELGIPLPRFFSFPEDLPLRLREAAPHYFFAEDLAEARKRLLLNLVGINGVILAVSALAGYFLAGRTLAPIENSLEEQKRFVADASHELRTPLTALKTTMEVALRDKKMSLTAARQIMADNLHSVDDLKSLSDKLLSLARYQSNGGNLTFEKVEIKELIEKAVKKMEPVAKEKEIEIEIGSGKREARSGKIVGNRESLEEMMLIFLDNAVKFTPKGGKVTVDTEARGQRLEIKIKDTGVGIAKEDLPHIFDRFYRADQSRSRQKVDGFGLGLSLAKKIIEIHKGTVEAESKVGEGTEFTVRLPLTIPRH